MRILLGIQPTGNIHIGNYFGALRKGLELQKEGHEVIFLIANYHAGKGRCSNVVTDMAVELIKLGAYQGSIRRQTMETLELFYLLSHETMVAELARLPQYATKEKTLHMLSYPLLMAADIMIADCEAVIVGDDQEPHMHFYREVVRNQGGEEAKTIKSETPRIMSIKDPSKKMSKSLGDEHCIYINDDEETIRKKIGKAPTTPEGIENLKVIGALFGYSDYDSSKNADSKEKLVQAIISYKYKVCI